MAESTKTGDYVDVEYDAGYYYLLTEDQGAILISKHKLDDGSELFVRSINHSGSGTLKPTDIEIVNNGVDTFLMMQVVLEEGSNEYASLLALSVSTGDLLWSKKSKNILAESASAFTL